MVTRPSWRSLVKFTKENRVRNLAFTHNDRKNFTMDYTTTILILCALMGAMAVCGMACPTATVVKGCDFAQFLVDQQPVYDKLILEDITPIDGWVGNMAMGTFPAFSGVEHTLDRFTDVWPDTTKTWTRVQDGSCLGTPCDQNRYVIGWGAKRLTYFLEQQSWKTQLLCYDQEMHVTHAREHFAQIISNVLKPATSAIQSEFMRKRALLNAGKKWVACFDMRDFTFQFSLGPLGNEEIFFDCSVPPSGSQNGSAKKLTPQMLQRRFEPLMSIGYAGRNPFKETAPFIELVTDVSTCWELDKLGGQQGVGGTPSINGNWRFTEWGDANKYWRYGFSGSIGNYMVRADHNGLRFNYVRDLGAAQAPNRYRYQVVLPYKNVTTGGAGGAPGLQRVRNNDFDLALYRISYIWHKKGMEALVADATPVNKEMPYSSRNFGGRWQFVMDNLGEDVNGRAIENFLRNKGMFVADFKLAIRPMYTEFVEAIFHLGEPQCVQEINTCSGDPGYPTQSYNSANENCGDSNINILFTPQLATHADGTSGTYEILANTITCDGEPVSHAAITGSSSLPVLVQQLNQLVQIGAGAGSWTVQGSQIQLQATACNNVIMPWLQSV